jgi:L-amino acid N-acyltransferase YncA
MTVSFRYASEDDLANIVSTYNSTVPSGMVTADLTEVSVESKRPWFQGHSPSERPLWIVSSEGHYAGWMSFTSFYGRPAYDGTVEVSIYLEQKFRGQGIGKVCLEKAIYEAPSFKIHTLLGFIFGHNAPSIRLFIQLGFTQWALLPEIADMNGEMKDLLIFGRKVGIAESR